MVKSCPFGDAHHNDYKSAEIGGNTPGNGAGHYDQDNVTGTVSLGGATLNLSSFGGFVPGASDEYILINNDGGGIFSFLPQAAYPEHFEQLFGTPTGLDFRLAVQMYGGQFQRVEHWEQFREEVSRAMRAGGVVCMHVTSCWKRAKQGMM